MSDNNPAFDALSDVDAATLTIHHVADMTANGRKAIADWLVHQAQMLTAYPEQYGPRFTARYLYEQKEKP